MIDFIINKIIFLGDLNFDDLLLPEEGTSYINLDKDTSLQSKTTHLNNNLNSCPPQNILYQKDLQLPSSVPTGIVNVLTSYI